MYRNKIKKIFQFDWLLSIKTTNPLILLLLFQPIYFIWMYKIVRMGKKKLKIKQNRFFILINYFLLVLLIILIISILALSKNSELNALFLMYEDSVMTTFFGIVFFCWIYCSYYAMIMTIKLEEFSNENYYPTLSNKVYRFFQILYWIFGIWLIQEKINKYYKI